MDAGVSVEVRYAGDDVESLRRLCGDAADRINFRPQQHGGDLGKRLARAFSAAFLEGASRVAAIGTDCPRLNHGLVLKALSALETRDLVLGPATDGGYYLIASRAFHPELFVDIGWGGKNVLDDTLARANRSRLLVELLAPLADVDQPNDVEVLLREK
jgi:rSAM/selenodomain-associated transferase 1